ncbi:MAG: hypothetical protein ACOC46_01080, partial [Pirellulales bacterium]
MIRRMLRLVTCLGVIGLIASPLFAQGVITDIKTPPLQNSDHFFIPIDIHTNFSAPNWGGARMKVHILDASEVDIVSITPVTGPTRDPVGPTIISPFGPASENAASSPIFFTMWHPNAQNTGTNITSSVNQAIFDLEIHVKGSDPAGNSDVDVTFMFWNIWHLPDITESSQILGLQPSDYVYA